MLAFEQQPGEYGLPGFPPAIQQRGRPSELEMGKVFIGGLARETTTEGLRGYFARFGDISDCVVMKDRSTGLPRGFGFVTYSSQSVADRVVHHRRAPHDLAPHTARHAPHAAGPSLRTLETRPQTVPREACSTTAPPHLRPTRTNNWPLRRRALRLSLLTRAPLSARHRTQARRRRQGGRGQAGGAA